MKIGEAKTVYNVQLESYNSKKCELAKQQKELENKIKTTENGAKIYE